jgi:putative aldouronate transport system permease protein
VPAKSRRLPIDHFKEGSVKNRSFSKHYLLMLLPGYLWLAIFSIVPMFGLVMAFQDYNPGQGVFHSDWVGFDNFKYLLSLSDAKSIFYNTVFISVMKILGNLLVPLVFALMLNEVRSRATKKVVQTVVYLPHFLSWVILAGILLDIFAYRGPFNHLMAFFHQKPILFFARADIFPGLVIGSDVWKEFGFNAVIYLAALTGINPSLYEAASIDGAGRFQQLRHVTLPGISTTIILLTVLSLGNVLNAGFDQIFNMYNPVVYSTGDIIDTWVYRSGLLNLQFSLATTAGMFKSIIGFGMITLSYYLADRFANYKIF